VKKKKKETGSIISSSEIPNQITPWSLRLSAVTITVLSNSLFYSFLFLPFVTLIPTKPHSHILSLAIPN